MKMAMRLLSCAVALGMLGGILSCARLTLLEEPVEVADGTAPGGYPNIQAMIIASLDKGLAVVDAAAARSAERDPRYATLSRVLRRERDGNWATERVLNPNRPDEVTQKEQDEIDALVADDPELDTALGKLADELAAEYAAIPTIRIRVQNRDEQGNPIGEPYTIRSDKGVIDLGYRRLTSEEFLLWIQSQQSRPERGLAIGSSYEDGGRPWLNDTVKYFFDSSVAPDSVKTWMWWKLHRTQHATGVRFVQYADTGSRRYDWERLTRSYLRVSIEELGSNFTGRASVGQVRKSFLKMDDDLDFTSENAEGWFYHETGHVLGLIHEHQRADRDTYVTVHLRGRPYDRRLLWRNEENCFWIFGWPVFCWESAVHNTTYYDTPYDYHSVMHYPSAAGFIELDDNGAIWDCEGDVWDVWKHNKRVWGAQNHYTYFTPWDIYTIKRLYGIRPSPRPPYTPHPAHPACPSS